MNEIVLVSVITSCIWIVIAVVIGMYWRLKSIIDGDANIVCDFQSEINRRLDECIEKIEREIQTEISLISQTHDEIYRHIDSRVDKLQAKISTTKE